MPTRPVPPSEWRDPRHRHGLWGEREAIRHLVALGWRVEAHRFRLGRHDVDLIVRLGHQVAFVEVKTRSGTGYGTGAEAVRWAKRRSIARVAAVWRLRHGRPADVYRFDVLTVWGDGRGPARVEHLADAWRLDRWSAV